MPTLNLTPGAWLTLLNRKLDAQVQAVQPYENYYNGAHKLAFATARFKQAFSRYFSPMADNWMKLVVEAPVARLKVLGFRFDPDPTKASWEQAADSDAWEIWQANSMDAGSMQAHRESIKHGVAYALVTPNGLPDGMPLITVESALQCYVHVDPANRRNRLAAIKRWIDDDGYGYATVYLPDYVHRFRTVEKMRGSWGEGIQWTRRQTDGDDPVRGNPLGVVPMVPIENTPDLMYGGRSDLEDAIPIQDAVNKFCLDMQVSSEFHAFPQRHAAGWERAVDEATGKPLTNDQVSTKMGQTRILRSESPDTRFGTFEVGDVQNYIQPIEMYIDHMAAITETPAYYLKGKMANLSAEALQAADGGLVDRCRAKIDGAFSDNWEEVVRVAFLAKGDARRSKAMRAETIWADPEKKSLGQVVDAAVKMRNELSIPVEMVWEECLGWSPQKILQAKRIMGLPETPAQGTGGTGLGGGRPNTFRGEERPSGLLVPTN